MMVPFEAGLLAGLVVVVVGEMGEDFLAVGDGALSLLVVAVGSDGVVVVMGADGDAGPVKYQSGGSILVVSIGGEMR